MKNIFFYLVKRTETYYTIIKIKGKELHILNTHLGLKDQERIEQFQAIEKYLQSLIGLPYILMGDFNTSQPNFNNIKLIDSGKIMSLEHLETLVNSGKRIDYIFVSTTIQVLIIKFYK